MKSLKEYREKTLKEWTDGDDELVRMVQTKTGQDFHKLISQIVASMPSYGAKQQFIQMITLLCS